MFEPDEGPRGLGLFVAADIYGIPLSLQASSLAEREAIWVGSDRVLCPFFSEDPRACREGRCPAGKFHDIPGDANLNTSGRMHLDRDQAREFGRMLTAWADEGDEFWTAEQVRREKRKRESEADNG